MLWSVNIAGESAIENGLEATAPGLEGREVMEETAFRDIYAQIDRLETARTIAENYQKYVDVFPAFALLAFILLMIECALTATRLRAVA